MLVCTSRKASPAKAERTRGSSGPRDSPTPGGRCKLRRWWRHRRERERENPHGGRAGATGISEQRLGFCGPRSRYWSFAILCFEKLAEQLGLWNLSYESAKMPKLAPPKLAPPKLAPPARFWLRYSQMVCFNEQQRATQLWEDTLWLCSAPPHRVRALRVARLRECRLRIREVVGLREGSQVLRNLACSILFRPARRGRPTAM